MIAFLKPILLKATLPAICMLAGVVGGIAVQQKVLNAKPDPVDYEKISSIVSDGIARIPKPLPVQSVPIQPFNADDLKKIKGDFHYSPNLTGNVTVTGFDTTQVKRYITEAVLTAFKTYVHQEPKKKRRNEK